MFGEYGKAFSDYASTLTNANKLLFNIVHNLGNIYDLIEEVVLRFKDRERQINSIGFWARMGYISGSLF